MGVSMIGRFAVSSLALVGVFAASLHQHAIAQVDAPYQTREERDIYSPGPGEGGSVLDATNPLDLINRIRQSGAMNDATPPSDAIDAALKAYQQQSAAQP